MKEIKDRIINVFKKWGYILRHPILSARAYGEEMKTLDAKGKALKIAKTVGFVVVSALLIYYVLYLAIFLLLAFIILSAILGCSTKRMTYYEMLQQEEKEEYEQRTGKPW